ncbi:MAG: hypothetical protein P8016_16020 [Sedimentisphaerales bacterium]
MIDTKTVFILGAGSSKPYGYPVGWELKDEIIKKFGNYYKELIKVDKPGFRSMRPKLKRYYNDMMPKFIDALKRSNPDTSIDLFLSRNQVFADIGKLAIAMIILRSEITGTFRNSGYNPNEDWCSYLIRRMTEDLSAPDGFVKYKENKVSFITFNYDRSFDYCIYDRFIHDFGSIQDPENSASKFIPFPIIHVYGILSRLPWQEKNKYAYRRATGASDQNNAFYDFEMIESMSKNIRIIQERVNDEDIGAAKKLIEAANRIYFLGFGYADENLQVLGFPEIIGDKSVFGTVQGFTENEIGRVVKKVTTGKRPMKQMNTTSELVVS